MSEEAFQRYCAVRAAIDAKLKAVGRESEKVRVIAVSKTKPVETMLALIESGRSSKDRVIFGENYIQEFAEKHRHLPSDCECHFIGRLQRNKTKDAVRLFSVIQSVDSQPLAEAIDRAADKIEKQQEIYLQVNISRDANKSGFSPEHLPAFIRESAPLLTNVKITGLMTITALYEEAEDARNDFRALRELRDSLLENATVRHALGRLSLELSMGMSSDFLVAVEEGATVVRIGTAIFGER